MSLNRSLSHVRLRIFVLLSIAICVHATHADVESKSAKEDSPLAAESWRSRFAKTVDDDAISSAFLKELDAALRLQRNRKADLLGGVYYFDKASAHLSPILSHEVQDLQRAIMRSFGSKGPTVIRAFRASKPDNVEELLALSNSLIASPFRGSPYEWYASELIVGEKGAVKREWPLGYGLQCLHDAAAWTIADQHSDDEQVSKHMKEASANFSAADPIIRASAIASIAGIRSNSLDLNSELGRISKEDIILSMRKLAYNSLVCNAHFSKDAFRQATRLADTPSKEAAMLLRLDPRQKRLVATMASRMDTRPGGSSLAKYGLALICNAALEGDKDTLRRLMVPLMRAIDQAIDSRSPDLGDYIAVAMSIPEYEDRLLRTLKPHLDGKTVGGNANSTMYLEIDKLVRVLESRNAGH